MEYNITISEFSGPLDLLLHLIKQSDIDIYDIKIEEITQQYLDYIKKMEELNLNIASSYLIMAAELIEIKSSMLLPKPEMTEDDFEDDPKNELIKRLIEYKNYKEVIDKFQELETDRQQYYTKQPSELNELETNNKLPDDINLTDLLSAFENFLNRKEITKPLNTKITTKEYSISQRTQEIKNILKQKKKISFSELFEIKSKNFIVVTFFSILVLASKNEVNIIQEKNFEDILLSEVKS